MFVKTRRNRVLITQYSAQRKDTANSCEWSGRVLNIDGRPFIIMSKRVRQFIFQVVPKICLVHKVDWMECPLISLIFVMNCSERKYEFPTRVQFTRKHLNAQYQCKHWCSNCCNHCTGAGLCTRREVSTPVELIFCWPYLALHRPLSNTTQFFQFNQPYAVSDLLNGIVPSCFKQWSKVAQCGTMPYSWESLEDASKNL